MTILDCHMIISYSVPSGIRPILARNGGIPTLIPLLRGLAPVCAHRLDEDAASPGRFKPSGSGEGRHGGPGRTEEETCQEQRVRTAD